MTADGRTDYPDAPTQITCARKKAYPEAKVASKVARRMTEANARPDAQPGWAGIVVVAYACTRCGRYHVGRAPA